MELVVLQYAEEFTQVQVKMGFGHHCHYNDDTLVH